MQTVINILMISLVTVFLGSCSDTTFEPETPAKMLENRSPDGNIDPVMDTSSDQSNFEDVDTSTLVINILSLTDTSVELSWTPLEGNGELVDYFLFSSIDPLDFPSDINSFYDNVGFYRETSSKQAQTKVENLVPDTVIYFYVYAEKNNIRLPYQRLQTRTLTGTDT